MPRPKLADEANCIYHALNRGNAKSPIFKIDAQLHRHALDSCSASSLSKRMAAGWIQVLLSSLESEEFYDHENDPHERHNLAAQANNAIIKSKLAKSLPKHDETQGKQQKS